MTFQVQRKMCASCIYRPDSPLDIAKLEADVADAYGGFTGYRECHSTKGGSKVCCSGFWSRHSNKFALGQIAQRLSLVEFVDIDVLAKQHARRSENRKVT